jgi:cytochrome c-type biogenesis protein
MYQGADSVGGSEFLFSSLFTQGKPVVLNFWAGLCPPCRAEMPDIQDVADQFGDQIVILGLDIGPFVGLGSRDDGRALLRELGVTYPAGTTFESKVVRDYGILGMPTTVFLSPDGKVFRKWTGLITKGKMTEIIQQVLQSSSS